MFKKIVVRCFVAKTCVSVTESLTFESVVHRQALFIDKVVHVPIEMLFKGVRLLLKVRRCCYCQGYRRSDCNAAPGPIRVVVCSSAVAILEKKTWIRSVQ